MAARRMPLFIFILHQSWIGACDRERQLAQGPITKMNTLIW